MMDPHTDSEQDLEQMSAGIPAEQPAEEVLPPIGITPPQILARDAANGSRGSAWRLLLAITKNDPQAIAAVSTCDDERLARNLVECIALGTWAGKPFTLPVQLRTAQARNRLRTLFMPGAGIETTIAERILTEAARDPRPAMRGTAIYLLGMLGQPESLGILTKALKDPNLSVRMQAVDALGRIGNASAVPDLLQALHGADEHMASHVFAALVRLGRAATPALIQECNSTRSAWIRWYCIRALGEIRDRRAIPVLVNGLSDTDHSVAWMSAKSLVMMGRSSVGPVLSLLSSKEITPWLVETASYVLQHISRRETAFRPYLDTVIEQMHDVGYQVSTPLIAYKTLADLRVAGLVESEQPRV